MFAEPRRFRFEPQGGSVKTLLVGWAIAEALALILVIRIVGFGGAVLLSIGSSLLGVVLLRRLGFDAARHLRATFGRGAAPEGALLDGMLSALGALFLILPGFVSDAAGLALAAPSMRQWVASRIGGSARSAVAGRARRSSSGVIDLPASDWHVVDRSEPR